MRLIKIKISTVFFVFSLLQITANVFAQNATVSIQAESISLEQLFAEIEKQTDVKFLYRYEHIAGKKTKINIKNAPVSVVLVEALKTNGLQYTVMDNNLIVVAPEVTVASPEMKRYISGRITDAGNGEPITGASVFIANTTVGASTDADGMYHLKIPGEGSYRLAVSHVGYQSVIMDIDPANASPVYDIALNIYEIEEVTVATRVRFRQKDIDLFWRKILGKKPGRRTIFVTNPEKVYYYYNAKSRILKVTCREPLQIINYETGYHIHYLLNSFKHDYNTDISEWDEQSVFTELEPVNQQQKDLWTKNRKKVYQVSTTKFIKSLYNNSLTDDGFLLASSRNSALKLSYLSPDSILSIDSTENSRTLNLPKNEVILICYGRPVTDNDLVNVMLEYWKNHGLFMNLLRGDSIRIFPDGTYTNRLYMTPIHSGSLMGLCMVLPTDYHPGMSTLPADFDPPSLKYDLAGVAQRFNIQLSFSPQEKIHLHTDRDFYVPGEKIWFKAYVVDAHSHQYPTYSRYVYVELISQVDTLVNRVLIRQTGDMFHGHLPLTDKIPEGNYTLRAYTRYMENLGDDYFFKKNIRIGNLAKSRENEESNGKRESRRSRENQINQINHTNQINHINHSPDFDVSFYPEGGNLLEGVFCKVAFKAMNQNGYPETVSGKLLNENGEELTSVNTVYAGMGVLGYIPEMGKRIYLKCNNANGLEKQFELPQPEPHAWSLTASLRGKRFLIGVQPSIQAPDVPCYLLAHCRGEVLYFAEWNKKQTFISFMEDQLPAGVIQFVLFDPQLNPLSERLVFNKNDDATAKLAFQTDKEVYEKREKVIVALSPSLWGRAGVGLSVAITDNKDLSVDSTTTIMSSLLLSSELKGYIENPAYYLLDNIESATALDYLMMTHGWRRYNVPQVVKGYIESPQIPFQMDQRITGNVTSLLSSKPAADSEIILMSKDEGVRITTTDEKGSFVFRDFDIPDSASYFLQALNSKGRSISLKLEMNQESFPEMVRILDFPATETETKIETAVSAFMEKAEQRAMYDDDIRLIHLEEVVISAQRKTIKRDEPRLLFYANQSAETTLRRDVFEKIHLQYVSDYLRLVGGVMVYPNGSIGIRGGVSGGYGLPLVFIDGIEQDWPEKMMHVSQSPLERVPVSMIESIDVLKGFGAAIFGMRGANGAISITTKRGEGIPPTEKSYHAVYTPLGYQKPVEFYSPKYDTQEAKWSAIPDYRTTIFWKPDVVISEDGEAASFEFYTSDFKTTYSVVIEGITADGRIVRQVEKIRVE